MSDLPFPSGDDHAELMREAWSGDEVAALRAERDRYRDALERIEYRMSVAMYPGNDKYREIEGSLIDARAALTPIEESTNG